MKVLLSAYACEPNKGSEPGVGWHWALEIARLGHQVWVLTRTNNKKLIQNYKYDFPQKENINFIYYDVPKFLSFWKRGARGVHLYYFLWQIGAFFIARKWDKKIGFNRVHHITFVTARQPSFMGLLGIDFIFGPTAGGDKAPNKLRKNFPYSGKMRDLLRDIANSAVKYDPLMHLTFRTANKIYVNSSDSLNLIPSIYHYKCKLKLAIGVDDNLVCDLVPHRGESNDGVKFLYVGRLEYFKGIDIAISAFSKILRYHPNSIFTIVGSGPEKRNLVTMVDQLKINDFVEFIDWVKQDELPSIYINHDVFIFPSLRDSGGMVILEALANGLPVVCFDLGGGGVIIDNSCGAKIISRDSAFEEVVDSMVSGTRDLINRRTSTLYQACIMRAKVFSWSNVVSDLYEHG